ncbi:MAG TPA: MFS transporter, partial [Micromonosporaceae bacterium]
MNTGLIRRHTAFRRLWIGQTISEIGTQIGGLAVPLIAVLTLHASAFGASALFAAEFAPYVIVGLPAGAWIDRLRRRPILICADVTRGIALLVLPLAVLLHAVSLPLLYGVVFVVGVATVFFEVAYQAYLPAVVEPGELVDANGLLTASRSIASVGGPSVGGWIVAVLTAPYAVVADAISFLISAGFVATVRKTEPPTAPATERRGLHREIGEGIRVVWTDRLIRTLALYSAATSFCVMMAGSIEVYFLVRTVHLATVGIGVLFGITSLGSLLGAVVAAPVRRRLGEIRTLVTMASVAGTSMLLVPLTALGLRLGFFVLGIGLASAAIVAYNVVSISMIQRRCPARLLGRVFATIRFIAWSTPPIGALVGGALAGAIGPRATLLIAALMFVASALALAWWLRDGAPSEP